MVDGKFPRAVMKIHHRFDYFLFLEKDKQPRRSTIPGKPHRFGRKNMV
jgi:hypothetical protein